MVEQSCLIEADGRLLQAFTKAEAATGNINCPTTNDAPAIRQLVATFTADVAATLRPRDDASQCGARKLKATATTTYAILKAYGMHGKKTDDIKLSSRLEKADSKFLAAFAKAEANAATSSTPCLTSEDATSIRAKIADVIAKVATRLRIGEVPVAIGGTNLILPVPPGWTLYQADTPDITIANVESPSGSSFLIFPPGGFAYDVLGDDFVETATSTSVLGLNVTREDIASKERIVLSHIDLSSVEAAPELIVELRPHIDSTTDMAWLEAILDSLRLGPQP